MIPHWGILCSPLIDRAGSCVQPIQMTGQVGVGPRRRRRRCRGCRLGAAGAGRPPSLPLRLLGRRHPREGGDRRARLVVAGAALHVANGVLFGLAFHEVRRRRALDPRVLALAMALGEHVALYPLGGLVDRFHPRRGTPGIPPLSTNGRAFAQATWRHALRRRPRRARGRRSRTGANGARDARTAARRRSARRTELDGDGLLHPHERNRDAAGRVLEPLERPEAVRRVQRLAGERGHELEAREPLGRRSPSHRERIRRPTPRRAYVGAVYMARTRAGSTDGSSSVLSRPGVWFPPYRVARRLQPPHPASAPPPRRRSTFRRRSAACRCP